MVDVGGTERTVVNVHLTAARRKPTLLDPELELELGVEQSWFSPRRGQVDVDDGPLSPSHIHHVGAGLRRVGGAVISPVTSQEDNGERGAPQASA